MCEENHIQLWVIKFCLKVVFPKYNLYFFLVYLGIRYRIFCYRQKHNKVTHTPAHSMETLKMCCIPSELQKKLVSESSKEATTSEHYSICLVVSYESYVRMAIENPFYYDRNTVWTALHLAPTLREKLKRKLRTADGAKSFKYNLKQMKSEIHKKLWTKDQEHESYDKIRIVRIVGCKHISEDLILVTEDEEYNIKSCFNLLFEETEVHLRLGPVGSMDHLPQIATSAVVQMILNPYDLSNDFVTELLSNFFKSPRLVHADDIFSITLTKEMTTKYHYKYFDLIESTPKVYFKCCKINCDVKDSLKQVNNQLGSRVQTPYFIVKGKTELNLGENIHSMASAIKHFNFGAARRSNILIDSCPFGLKHNFHKMQDSIFPFLANKQGNPLYTSLATPIMPIFLLSGPMGSGRHLLVKTLAKYNGMNCMVVDCNAIQSTTAKQTESKISSVIQKAKTCSPVVVLMDNFEVFAVDAESNEDCRVLEYFHNVTTSLFEHYSKQPIVIVAVSERTDLKPNILRIFLDKFHLARPTAADRFDMLAWYMTAMQLKFCSLPSIEKSEDNSEEMNVLHTADPRLDEASKNVLQRISAKTETFLYGDLDTLVHFALRNSFMNQHSDTSDNVGDEPILENIKEEDFANALECMRALQSQHMDAPKIPKVYWQDIGGLDALKKELLKTIEFPIKYPHLFKNSSLKRSGILLYGPPGCGKTLIAKALSTELNVSFLSVKGPELLNMYIGQSEENVRKVFESARAASPCIVFLDELDALAPRRGATGDSGGASDRVVSQLLAEIDGVADSVDRTAGSESSNFVFIMGATNRPDLLEQSLLRPGRLDKLIYVGPYCGLEEKTRVLTALCHRRKLGPHVVLSEVARALPERCTGADLLQVVKVARATAVRRVIAKLHAGEMKEAELDSDSVVLEAEDLLAGVSAFKPSTTDDEFAYYQRLRTQM